MTNDANSSLARELMQAIHQTDEWDRIWTQDPAIQEARSHLETVMEAVKPKELRDSLLDATSGLTTACENAAIRYGARIALVLLNAAGNPF